jgi:hypothetical protein
MYKQRTTHALSLSLSCQQYCIFDLFVGQFVEPTSQGCGPPPGDTFKILLDTGCSVMEANFINVSADVIKLPNPGTNPPITGPDYVPLWVLNSGVGTALGDPLYSPYLNTVTSDTAIFPGTNGGASFPDGTVQGV